MSRTARKKSKKLSRREIAADAPASPIVAASAVASAVASAPASDGATKLARRRLRVAALALMALTLVAGLLRFVGLTALPAGFHGDEAVAGFEGARILREGNIGVYSPLALGQPTGPLYLTALGVKLWGQSILATRFFSALLGTLCVPLLYGFLRAHVNARAAFASAGLLACLGWHIHFSRIGFPLISWPLCALLAMWALFAALRRGDWRWFALAGAVCGLGIYSYNAHAVFIATELSFLLFVLARQRETAAAGTRALWLLAFGAALLAVAAPMLRFALEPSNGYFAHSQVISIFGTPAWAEQNSLGTQARFLALRYFGYWAELVWAPKWAIGDGSGVTPLVPAGLAALTAVGIGFAIARRQSVALFASWLLLVAPVAAVVTFDGSARRTFLVALSVAILAGFGLTELGRMLAARRPRQKSVIASALTLWCLWIGATELRNYYVINLRSAPMDWVFCRDLQESSVWMNRLPANARVFFLSDRWSFDYETRVFLAPHVRGENRSDEFANFNLNSDPNLQRPAAYVLLGKYREQLETLQRMYPGGQIARGNPTRENGEPSFIGYYVGASPESRVAPPEP